MKTLVVSGGGSLGSDTFVASAATSDGKLLLAYIPPTHSGDVTIDMTAMAGATKAQFWDPTNGSTSDAGSALSNTGTHAFTPPSANGEGSHDWVLMPTSP